jgi:hypothetical protein
MVKDSMPFGRKRGKDVQAPPKKTLEQKQAQFRLLRDANLDRLLESWNEIRMHQNTRAGHLHDPGRLDEIFEKINARLRELKRAEIERADLP